LAQWCSGALDHCSISHNDQIVVACDLRMQNGIFAKIKSSNVNCSNTIAITTGCFTSSRSSADYSGLNCSNTIAITNSCFTSSHSGADCSGPNCSNTDCSGLKCSNTIATAPGRFKYPEETKSNYWILIGQKNTDPTILVSVKHCLKLKNLAVYQF
jgi:hypothetical protein